MDYFEMLIRDLVKHQMIELVDLSIVKTFTRNTG